MGVAIPQVITPSRATGAQVIDGSLKFDSSKSNYLNRTPSSSGNRKTWTWSGWVQKTGVGTQSFIFSCLPSGSYFQSYFSSDKLYLQANTPTFYVETTQVFRDLGWYHIVIVLDTPQTDPTDRLKLYVNGEEVTSFGVDQRSSLTQDADLRINDTESHSIGSQQPLGAVYANFNLSNIYFIDGQALTADSFGFTDPLTNTWKPKKYTGTFTGTNTFYLPFDGSAPIGQDKSGNGNNWTPVSFGGSVALDNPIVSGALPILNTDGGGNVARPGVFGSEVGFRDTVSGSSGGGNPYIFDTNGTQPTFNFIRGATYVFDYSSATSHPLRFATAADAAGSTEYTDGTSVSGNVISFTVPHNAPNTLYYYCTNHNGMGNSISVTTDETKADPYVSHCVLALPLLGNKEDISNQINSGSTTKVMTAIGNAAASSDTSNFYDGSFEFDGSGDGITTPTNTDFDFGSGEFTIECWVKQDTTNAWRVFVAKYGGSGDREFYMGHNSSGKPVFIDGGGTTFTSTNFTANTNKWYHMAVCREGSATTMYINGVCEASGASSTQSALSNKLTIGVEDDESSSSFDGYLQDVRIYKGAAKYSGTTVGTQYFVVPSTSPDILPETPSGVSGGSKLAKVTDGAVNFDGSGDYLDAGAVDTAFGSSSDWTLELFIYPRTVGLTAIIDPRTGDSTNHPLIWIKSTGVLYYYAGGADRIVGTTVLATNKWHHVAAVRSGGTTNLYLDGKSEGSFSDSLDYASTTNFRIGQRYTSTAYNYNGFISNLRLVDGTALYTTDFTPPTRELTNVTNTKLLCCQSNTFVGSAAVSPNISGLNNGTQWSYYTTTTKGTGGSKDFYATGNDANHLFDGDTSLDCYGGYGGDGTNSDIVFSPPGGVAVSSKLEVYVGYYSKIKVNGSDYNTGGESTAQAWVTVSDGSNFTGTLNTLILENTSNANVVRASAIRIDDSTILLDPVSPEGNAAATNFNPFNTDINTVRGQETGYPTLNPLDMRASTVLSNGNLTVTGASGAWYLARSTQFLTTGKYYWEYKWYGNVIDENNGTQAGLKTPTSTLSAAAEQTGSFAFQYTSIYQTAGSNNTVVISPGSITPGDCVMFAYDADAGLMWFGANGIWNDGANPALGTNSDWTSLPTTGLAPFAGVYGTAIKMDLNFGQKPFKYAPPDGFQPINAANTRPVKVISRPDQYVGVTTYNGDDQASHIINDLNFSAVPDLVWLKKRTGSGGNQLYDTIRGATKVLQSDSTNDEDTQSTGLLSFVRNGFELGSSSVVNGLDGDNGNVPFNYVAWCWKAGGNKNTFNVDDVGYASASDVNMGVGDLNSLVYDQSQTWSNAPFFAATNGSANTATPDKAFDASTAYGNSNGVLPAGSVFDWDFSSVFSNAKTVTIKTEAGGSASNRLKINGTDVAVSNGNGSVTVDVTGTGFNSLQQNKSGSDYCYIFDITVDGVLLVNSGVTPPNAPSIAPTGASVGTKQGFSIIRYVGNDTVGATVPHGLTQAPDFFVTKADYDNREWQVYHQGLGNQQPIRFTEQAAQAANAAYFNNTSPSSSVVTFGNGGDANQGGETPLTYIMYAWHDVPGLQKFGSYTGVNSADGPFLELGFRPSIIMFKNISSGSTEWVILDNKRNGFNGTAGNNILFPSTAGDENATQYGDFLSNGWKFRINSSYVNSTDTFIYCAWAEAPSIDLYGGGANAR